MMSKENVFNNLDNIVISSGKKFVSVKFLNQETVYFGVEKKCKVNELFSKICVHLGLADCAELFGLAIKQINYPTSLFGPLTNSSHYYSASQVEESIRQDDTQFEEEYIFLNPNAKLSKYTIKQWKNSKNGLDSMGKAYLECFFRVQFYVDSYLFITDRIARHHYYLQLRQNVINYSLANLTLERAFLLTSLALQAEKGNYNHQILQSKSILNSTFLNNENSNQLNQLNDLGKCYFDPFDYMPKWIVYQMGESYICENMPTMHKEQDGIGRTDAEIMFIKESSEICPHNLHMYRLFKTNQSSSFNKKLNNVNNHFNAFFHGHHFNSSINSNSSHSSTMTTHSSSVSNNSYLSNNLSSNSNKDKESKVWLAISATGVQLFEQDKQVFINKSNNNSFLDTNSQERSRNRDHELQSDSSSTICYLRSKLSMFIWQDIEKLFFDKKKFEIRSNGYPARKFTYYTHSDEMAKNLLWLCKMSHRFQLFIQPRLKEMKKRETELSRRKYRESYIYSDKTTNERENKESIKSISANDLLDYQQEPSSNKYLLVKKKDNSSLTASQNTLVGKESLHLSQNKDFNLRPLSDDMQPIMDKFDRQISKLQLDQMNHNLIDLESSNNQSIKSTTNQSVASDKLNKSNDQLDFMSGLTELQKYNQINTNPFLDKSNYGIQINSQMFCLQGQLEHFDEYVIEHKKEPENESYPINELTVQPSMTEPSEPHQPSNRTLLQLDQENGTSLGAKLEENLNGSFQSSNVKPNKQTFSLESLTCSGLSEPSSSGISEQEFSTSSDHNGGGNSSLCSPPNLEHTQPFSNLNNHLNNESPNSMQSRCSSNTSYSSDSALGKCSKLTMKNSKLPVPTQRVCKDNYRKSDTQKLQQYACSVNDLNKQEKYFATINNNHLLEDFNRDLIGDANDQNSDKKQTPKPRARKSKFEIKNKNKLNVIQYKSLPNVNDFDSSSTSRFGRLETIDSNEKERFNFLNRSDKSTSSEQSVSTIKSNKKTGSSTRLNDESNYHSNYLFTNQNSSNQLWINSVQDKRQNLKAIKNRAHIYENLPFQNSVNNLLNGNRTPQMSSFLPAPNLITTTPNRIATKIGVSSLNRCNKLGFNHNSAQKNANLRLNLFDTNLDKQNLRTCSYQLLNNENMSTINDPNQSKITFKTIRASSDPGVLTFSSTSNLMKIQSKDSFVFYQNPPDASQTATNQSIQSPQLIIKPPNRFKDSNNYYSQNLTPPKVPMLHCSLNNISGMNNNLAYDQPLIHQIKNQRKASIKKDQNLQNFHPLRMADSEMNLISSNTSQITYLPPPLEFAQNESNYQNYRQKATSEQHLNRMEASHFANKLNQHYQKSNSDNKQTDSIDNLQQLKQKSHDLDLPLITALFNDKSLIVLPKTVPSCSSQKHQKLKRYSWHLENTPPLLNSNATDIITNLSHPTQEPRSYQQTNLDEDTVFDDRSSNSSHLKYDKNYNNLDSNNLNTTFEMSNSQFDR